MRNPNKMWPHRDPSRCQMPMSKRERLGEAELWSSSFIHNRIKATELDHHSATKTYCACSLMLLRYKVLTSFDRVLFTWTHHHFSLHRKLKIIFLFGFSSLAFNKLLPKRSETFQYLRHFWISTFGFRLFCHLGPHKLSKKIVKKRKKIMKNDAPNVHKKVLKSSEKTLSLLRFVSAS